MSTGVQTMINWRVGDAVGQIGRAAIDRAEPCGPPCETRSSPPADADDFAGQFPFAQRQPDRAADQPDADNGHRVELSHDGILEGGGRRREGVAVGVGGACRIYAANRRAT